MATLPTYAKVGFKDASGRITEVTYRLQTEWSDNLDNQEDVVNNVEDVRSWVTQLSSARIDYVHLVVDFGGTGTADGASNNQVVAFTRSTFPDDTTDSFEVPSWDAAEYEQDVNNLMDAAYQADAESFSAKIRSKDGEWVMDSGAQWSQSRARKGRQTVG